MTTDTTEPKTFTFRFPSMVDSNNFPARSLLMDALHADHSLNLKWRSILRLGIKVLPGDDPSDAWLRAMCDENGEPYTTPVSHELASALVSCRPAYVYFFWLT